MVDTYMYIQKTGFEWKQNKLYMYIPNNKEIYVFGNRRKNIQVSIMIFGDCSICSLFTCT